MLNNGLWLQNTWGNSLPGLAVNVWKYNAGVEYVNGSVLIINKLINAYALWGTQMDCGWLVISIRDGTAYFGYSTDGVNVDWYYTYPVGNASIISGVGTELIVGGYDYYHPTAYITSASITLAWYYWNGSAWQPAPGTAYSILNHTIPPQWANQMTAEEWVNNAWIHWSGNTAVITWPEPTNQTPIIPPPSFKP